MQIIFCRDIYGFIQLFQFQRLEKCPFLQIADQSNITNIFQFGFGGYLDLKSSVNMPLIKLSRM